MKVLVTGGAGYIGSHAVKALVAAGHEPVVVDNLDRGHRAAVPSDVSFEQANTLDTAEMVEILRRYGIEGVMHFAAHSMVNESVPFPLKYYENNTGGSVSLLNAMDAAGVKRIVFSSTAATYGEPEEMPITEDTPQRPVNPYGWSKLMTEIALRDYAAANDDFAFAALRYFNVAGCAADGSLGEDHDPETHLIPNILLGSIGSTPTMTIHGDDYPTPDGTCIRDYVHVEDLVDAHIHVMDRLEPGDARAYNLGIGNGQSVKQVVDAAKKVTGVDIDAKIGPRRPGDPPMLYANVDKIKNELGWQAKITDIEEIVATAWNWFKDHPNGYDD